MKFSSTMLLALVLAAGMAAAAAAQTAPSTSDPKSTVSEPKPTVVKPMTGSTQTQPGMNENKATSPGPMKSSEAKAIEPKAKSAEMKATQPRAKRIAHVKAVHPKQIAQMKAMHGSAKRVAHLRHPAMQGQHLAQAQKLSPDQVKGAQEQLKSAGLYNGPTDGMMDPDTRAALARFQQQNGLRQTQSLDQKTLARMNSGQTTGFGSSAPSANQGTSAPPSAGGNTTGQQPINR
jgi:putative peptidoglycan binding protein